jgi:hypothetical protein
LRVRPEFTLVEQLTVPYFTGRLPDLLTSIRLTCKTLSWTNTLAYTSPPSVTKKIVFITLTPGSGKETGENRERV